MTELREMGMTWGDILEFWNECIIEAKWLDKIVREGRKPRGYDVWKLCIDNKWGKEKLRELAYRYELIVPKS
ncbi:hypothetical protein [uncultured Roseivirga sp.]|uniref:hypothetical protein n=1 Tax=uncultured Roseivirga sp. TaxID=543088 RepID=UPI00258C4965|nr:hypothetical protein [uncultured Roseivirga sp.]